MKNEAESQAVFAVSYVRNVRGRGMLRDSTVDCLCLSLKDKAAEYFVLVSETNALSYDQLLSKLEMRFGDTELPAAALVRFQKATQSFQEIDPIDPLRHSPMTNTIEIK